MKKNINGIPRLAALLLLAALTVLAARPPQRSSAYFTTYVRTAGEARVSLRDEAKFEEHLNGLNKELTITNTACDNAVFVRARVMAGSTAGVRCHGSNWSDGGDGFWYYALPLEKGQSAAVFYVDMNPDPALKQDFNVIVAEETVPASYRADGTAYADWGGAQ